MYDHLLERKAEEALSDTLVVLIVGPRRAGKTTLVRKIGGTDRTYITHDDRTTARRRAIRSGRFRSRPERGDHR